MEFTRVKQHCVACAVQGSPPERGGACESKTYTVIEDRPIEFERRTTVLEHHLFEKTFAVETRLVAERELTDKTTVRYR